MAISNQDRISKALELLRAGMAPFVAREFTAKFKDEANAKAEMFLNTERLRGDKPIADWDIAALLRVIWEAWSVVFNNILGQTERNYVSELRTVRDKWAHQTAFSSDDAERALDSMVRLLNSVSAPEAQEVDKMRIELRRLTIEEQVRGERRKAGGVVIEGAASGTLKPWREIVTPHADVASGRYQQAEFAADLWQVHLGEGADEYKNPAEFFSRTYLTESLKGLLVGGVKRISGKGGDPVVQLQTNFGGGKTHSMLALFHLFSGTPASELAGVDALLVAAGLGSLPKAKRVVFVGNKISPGNPVTKADGTVVRTLWGELAWQLGGKQAFARVKADDERATNPGDVMRELFKEYGPCLILIDEWVAYARQLHDKGDLPAGDFETQFTFAQALTESAKNAGNCLLVISLPASQSADLPHAQAEDVEVGGVRGREALERLANVVGRVESSWRPATAEESFEIVRRRLFEPLTGPESFKQRDVTARAFADLYSKQAAEFPPECKAGDYEKRIQAAFPIHPEIFERLYTDWSTLVKFQRTRGVLRLMAAVIHSLWEKGDRNPLIMPSTIPIGDVRVQSELTRYLSDNWAPIIERDVDGPDSLPLKIDGEQPNLGKLQATQRVARTIYLGSAPTAAAAHRGLEDRRVKLGCVMPGEAPAVFSDALRRLAATATYLYSDNNQRFWYGTQPTVTKLAEDRAEQLKRDPDKVAQELEKRLRADLSKKGDFTRVHAMPHSGADVLDDFDARLVVLPAEYSYSKDAGNAAQAKALAILESRGNAPRLYRNTLVFLAADKVRLADLEEAIRRFLAWESVLAEKAEQSLNLDPHQVKQAEAQKHAADGTVTARLPETYRWLLIPVQASPQAPVAWQTVQLSGSDALAVRASKKLRADEALVRTLGPTILRKHLDDVPLWQGDHVSIKQLVEHFARYHYLPRVSDASVLLKAISDGVNLLTWLQDTFALADSYDAVKQRYLGLRKQELIHLDDPLSARLLVKPEVAQLQLLAEASPTPPVGPVLPPIVGPLVVTPPRQPTRFHGTIRLDTVRAGRDASRIADEVIAHLAALAGATITVTLEIDAVIPEGVPEAAVRTVTENSRTLKFDSHGFESE